RSGAARKDAGVTRLPGSPPPGTPLPYGRAPGLPPGRPPAGMRGTVSGGAPDARGGGEQPDELVLPGPWYRIQAIPAPQRDPSAEWDFVSVLPAALSAARLGRPFVVGWLSAGGGAPLQLITNAGPVGTPEAGAESHGLLFPSGARGVPIGDGWLRQAERMAWT